MIVYLSQMAETSGENVCATVPMNLMVYTTLNMLGDIVITAPFFIESIRATSFLNVAVAVP